MSVLYRDLFQAYKDQDELPCDELPQPDSLPNNFLTELGTNWAHGESKTDLQRQFDRAVFTELLKRGGSDLLRTGFSPDADHTNRLGSLLKPRNTHFKRPWRSFLKRIDDRMRFDVVFPYVLRTAARSTSDWVLKAVFDIMEPTPDEMGVLVYDGAESTGPFDLSDELIKQTEAAKSYRSTLLSKTRGRDSKLDLKHRIQFYRTLFRRSNWTDEQRAWIIKNRAYSEQYERITKGSGFFRGIGQLHDGEAFFAGSSDPAVCSMTETFNALRCIEERAEQVCSGFKKGDFDYARTGLSGEEHDVAKDLLSDRKRDKFERWVENGGSVRAWEFYHAARVSRDDVTPLKMVEDHYAPDQEKLNRALRENLKALTDCTFSRFNEPLQGLKYLVEKGANLDQVYPDCPKEATAIDFVFRHAAQNDCEDQQVYTRLPECLSKFGIRPTRASRTLYETPPSIVTGDNIEVFEFLLTRNIRPEPLTLTSLEQSQPELYEALMERLPGRARKAVQAHRKAVA